MDTATINQTPAPVGHTPSPSALTVGASKSVASLLDFPSALSHVIEGKRISKKEWGSPYIWLELKDEWLQIHKASGTYHSVLLNAGDLIGVDWYVL